MRERRGRRRNSGPSIDRHSSLTADTFVKNRCPPMSKRKPLYSTVRAMPPTCESFSNTWTGCPCAASRYAAVRPAGPAPMTTWGAREDDSDMRVAAHAVAAQEANEEERVVPGHVSSRCVNLPQLRADRDRSDHERELGRRAALGDAEHRGREQDEREHDGTRHRLAGHNRRHQPAADAAALAPESERARAVRFGAFLVADRVVENRADEPPALRGTRQRQHRSANHERCEGEAENEPLELIASSPIVTDPGRRHEQRIEERADRRRKRHAGPGGAGGKRERQKGERGRGK